MKKTCVLMGIMWAFNTLQAMSPEEEARVYTSAPVGPLVFDNRTVNLDQDSGWKRSFREYIGSGIIGGREVVCSNLIGMTERVRQEDKNQALRHVAMLEGIIQQNKDSVSAFVGSLKHEHQTALEEKDRVITQLQTRATTAEQTLAGTSEALVRIHGDREGILEALRNAQSTGLTSEQIQFLLRQHQ